MKELNEKAKPCHEVITADEQTKRKVDRYVRLSRIEAAAKAKKKLLSEELKKLNKGENFTLVWRNAAGIEFKLGDGTNCHKDSYVCPASDYFQFKKA